jgi:uncharacterized membrane protein
MNLLAIHIALLLAAVATGLSLFLAKRSLTLEALPGCGGGSGCSAVLSSRWSKCGRLPVALLGAISYAVVALDAASLSFTQVLTQRIAWSVLIALAMSSALAACWFTGLQYLIIRRLCSYCMAIHILGLLIGLVVLGTTIRQRDYFHQIGVDSTLSTIGGAIGFLVFASVQCLLQPRLHSISRTDSTSNISTADDVARPALSAPMRPSFQLIPRLEQPRSHCFSRTISLLGGRVVLRSSDWPILGSPEARYTIACLFDYTCAACRQMCRQLLEVVAHYQGDLAVLMLPIPQHPACNTTVSHPLESATQACEYARLATLVSRHGLDAYAAFERWSLESEEVPSYEAALERARLLIGQSAITATALGGSEELLGRAVEIYAVSQTVKVPALLLPRARLTGALPCIEALLKILVKELGIPKLAVDPAKSRQSFSWQLGSSQ